MSKTIELMTMLAVARALNKCEELRPIPFGSRMGYNQIPNKHRKHKRGRAKR